jgi:uncharacterized protein HemY
MKLLRLRYSFEMLQAYLAQMMGDDESMNAYLKEADKLRHDIVLLELNQRIGLFDV